MEARNDLVEHYFNLGYKQKEILSRLLLIHDQKLSSRQLKRILAIILRLCTRCESRRQVSLEVQHGASPPKPRVKIFLEKSLVFCYANLKQKNKNKKKKKQTKNTKQPDSKLF